MDDGIAIVTIDNPPVNTIDSNVRSGLKDRLDELGALDNVRALLLLCSGKTFCSGADMGEFHG